MINNRCIMTRLSLMIEPKPKLLNILLLLSIISPILAFSPTLDHINDSAESTNKTAVLENQPLIKPFTINGTNPYKHILSDVEAELASESYSRINSIIRYVFMIIVFSTFQLLYWKLTQPNHILLLNTVTFNEIQYEWFPEDEEILVRHYMLITLKLMRKQEAGKNGKWLLLDLFALERAEVVLWSKHG